MEAIMLTARDLADHLADFLVQTLSVHTVRHRGITPDRVNHYVWLVRELSADFLVRPARFDPLVLNQARVPRHLASVV